MEVHEPDDNAPVATAPSPDKMLYVGGSKTSFRCDCGCNVFREIRPRTYRCNSCSALYRGE